MKKLDRMLIQHECEQLILRYAHLNDLGDWHGLADTFTEDAIFSRPSAPEEIIQGRHKILESFLARKPVWTVHVVTNIMVTTLSATEATSHCTIQLFQATPEAEGAVASHARETAIIGGSLDRFRCADEQWLFSERRGFLTIK
ncbi:MAG: nuclear transport factor 2 family protein [Candidatus Puniceispirillaceae bacterium]|jgi:ketosteroid isomerase-like protein